MAEASQIGKPVYFPASAAVQQSCAHLYCAAVDPLAAHPLDDYDQHRAGVPRYLPVPPPPHQRSPETSHISITTGKGCGACVHSGAVPVRRTPCWFGWVDGLAPTVVPLEMQYFPRDLAHSLGLAENRGWGRATCGCSSSGLGCAIGGNPLGTRQSYCATHDPSAGGRDGYVFLTSTVTPSTASVSSSSRLPPQNIATSPPDTQTAPIPRPRMNMDTQIGWGRETTVAYSPPVPPGPIPFIPPSPVLAARPPTSFAPPAPAPTLHPSAAVYTPPRRRRTLRRAASVEHYFAPEDGGADTPAAVGDASTAPRTAGTRIDVLQVPVNMSISAYMQMHADAFLARAAPPVPPDERIRAWQGAGARAASSGDAHRPTSTYLRSRARDGDDDGGSFEPPAHILDAAAPAPAGNDRGGFEPPAQIFAEEQNMSGEERRVPTFDLAVARPTVPVRSDDIWIDFGFAADPSAATRVGSQAPAWTDTMRTANADVDAAPPLAAPAPAPAPAPRVSVTTTRAMIAAERERLSELQTRLLALGSSPPPTSTASSLPSFASFTASANDTADALLARVGALVAEARAGAAAVGASGGGEGIEHGAREALDRAGSALIGDGLGDGRGSDDGGGRLGDGDGRRGWGTRGGG
ncbi:hypothetical protein B0H17DRAFT_1196211 [Mycena rosella]|uniref:Uncharacterized protein n=1 Tax=Mycena rosella TaxID=1033263 RepID=A0AAD7DUS2_MYCRO|nr:hypothetical protein B0H17DRAFT_1196211 [Mycena rosella]